MYKFGSIETKNLTDKFDSVFNTETYSEEVWFTKKLYQHREKGLNFDYRYAVSVYEVDADDVTKIIVELSLVMDPASMCKSTLESIAKSNGVEVSKVTQEDAWDYQGGLHIESITLGKDDNIDTVKDTIASVLDGVDSLRGFYLDRFQNRIGSTGWDYIREYKGQIKDAVMYTLKNWKKNHGKNKK